MVTVVTSEPTRLDLLAQEIYGNQSADTLRTIIWANPGIGINIPEGTEVELPEVTTVRLSPYDPI